MCPGSIAMMRPSRGRFLEGRSSDRFFQFQIEPGGFLSDLAKRRMKGSSAVMKVASVSETSIHFFQLSFVV